MTKKAARDLVQIQAISRAHLVALFSAEVHLESTHNSACFFQSKTVRHAWWFRVANQGLRKTSFLTPCPCAVVSTCPDADAGE